MNFDLSDEQSMFSTSVERFAAPVDSGGRQRLRSSPGGYSRERWQELVDLGLIALSVDEEAGGMGGSPIDLAVLAKAIGRAVTPDPWLENGVLVARLLASAGREEELTAVLAGEQFCAFAFAERAQRFNLVPKAVTLRRRGADYALHGEKTFVLGGAMADQFIVSADFEGRAVFLLIPADHEGVIRHPYRLADGSIACELRFTDARVSKHQALATDSDALANVVALIRLLAAGEMLGLAERLFEETLIFVKQREQFGVPIGSFQALQHRLVECYAALEQSRSIVYRAALYESSDRLEWNRRAAGAKAYVTAQTDLIAREAVQMHGGMGITDELIIGHAMKRALVLGRLFGDEETALAEYADAA